MNNNISLFFNEQSVIKLFKERILPNYPDFVSIKKIKIYPHKKYIFKKSHHLVIEFKTVFLTRKNRLKKISIFCTAHSEEPRKNVYNNLKFLWNNGFNRGGLIVPYPLFYSSRFRASFYCGIKGKNFYQFIKEKKYKEIEQIIIRASYWLAKLHNLSIRNIKGIKKNCIVEVRPGIKEILDKIKKRYSRYYLFYQKIYQIFNKKERESFALNSKRFLVHGDVHPKNIIKVDKKRLAFIDFTDICLSDFARDLGCFLCQLDFMAKSEISDKNINRFKRVFLESYLNKTKIKLDKSLKERIDNYYNWTNVRTATYFLIKKDPEPESAHNLLVKTGYSMNIPLKRF